MCNSSPLRIGSGLEQLRSLRKRWDVSRFVFYQETGQEVCVEVFLFLSASSNASRVILMKEGNHPLPRPRSCCPGGSAGPRLPLAAGLSLQRSWARHTPNPVDLPLSSARKLSEQTKAWTTGRQEDAADSTTGGSSQSPDTEKSRQPSVAGPQQLRQDLSTQESNA